MKNKSKHSKKDNGKSCSSLAMFSWGLIIGWIIFLLSIWKFGLIDQKKISIIVHDVDLAFNRTEQSIKNSLSHIHLKSSVAHLMAGDESFVFDLIPSKVNVQKSNFHVIFSTDCTPFQDWQSLIVFYSAKAVKQEGRVTRIASGCNVEKQEILKTLYKTLHPEYDVHFTPDFTRDNKTNQKCNIFFKPQQAKYICFKKNKQY
jgi:hypothetical protein